MWFTEYTGNKIGKISPATGTITEYDVPTAMAGPNGIAAGPDGNLWFTEYQGNNIGKITPATGVITEYAIPGSNYGNITNGITAGSDGNMWFAAGTGI